MKRNQLGDSNLFVSEIGLGCMSLPADKTEATAIIHRALDGGINFFDTADLYNHGENETLVGEALKGHRSEVIIATKVGNRHRADGNGWDWDPSKRYIKQAVHASLKRLNTDYIDLYQLHGGTIEDPTEETIEAFEELCNEGLIRYYGISSIRPNVIRRFFEKSGIVSVMAQYSVLDRRPEETVLPLLHESRINVIARGPVARGLLSSKTLTGSNPMSYLDYSSSEIVDVTRAIAQLADERRTVAQIALRFALTHAPVATVIPGASRLEQILENIGAGDVILTPDEIQQIKSVSKQNRYTDHR